MVNINDSSTQMNIESMWRNIEKMTAKLTKAREAVRFYGNQNNYRWRPIFGCKTYGYEVINEDKGGRARQALREIGDDR
jgi:hypothetical protein